MRHTTDFIHGEINFPNVGDQVKSFWGLMLFERMTPMTSFQNYNDDNNNNDDSNPSRSTRALSIQKRKGTVSLFFNTESLWKQPMSEKFYLSSWFYFKRIPLCVSTRTRERELWPRYFKLIHQVMQVFLPFYTSWYSRFFAWENLRNFLKSLTSCLNMLVVYNEKPPSHFLASICLYHNYLRFSMASPFCGLRNH